MYNKEKYAIWCFENPDKIKNACSVRHTCEICNANILRYQLKKHQRSNKHIKKVQEIELIKLQQQMVELKQLCLKN